MTYRKKLIEVELPLDAINAESAREKSIRHGHPSTLHLWWARRPLAACRAVLFGQLVDDPSSWPELFQTEEDQKRERERLFDVIRNLVKWENSNSATVLNAARLEIARSVARGRKADDEGDARDDAVLAVGVPPDEVNRYLAEVAPPVYDPFAGGGSIPLEAQRLGLRAYASDLNPVAVMINKALIEIPPKFAGRPAVNPRSRKDFGGGWKGAQGLAADVRYYGEWMREEAFKRIGHLYPKVQLPKEHGGGEATVIAWLWARTVASPNPAFRDVEVPLVASFWLSKKSGKLAWVEPIVGRETRKWRFEVRTGVPTDPEAVDAGTKIGRGTFRCLISDTPISTDYIQQEGRAGRLHDRLIAVVAEGRRGRAYVSPSDEQEQAARVPLPTWTPEFSFAKNSRHLTPWLYGMDTFAKLFTPRQLSTLVAFSDLIHEARERAMKDAGLVEGAGLEAGGDGACAYADAVAAYLTLGLSRRQDRWTSLSIWHTSGEKVESLIRLSAVPMTWEFAEANPFSTSTGNFIDGVDLTMTALDAVPFGGPGRVWQADARDANSAPSDLDGSGFILSTDPPYYDNIPYADLSDLFYVWIRRCAATLFPSVTRTVLVPKTAELVADPHRHGGKGEAEAFFLEGMNDVLRRLHSQMARGMPATVFYAFKQTESKGEGTVSTGWETFLNAAITQGFCVVGTWPIRTEQGGGLRVNGRNSLASSVVLVCRKRPENASPITRQVFRRLLRQELPRALKILQHGHIAPVDMAQAAIGPGMEIFSRHKAVLDADDRAMPVREALVLINEVLDEYLSEQDGEMDSASRFAMTWFEANGFKAGPFGEAEKLAKARNVSVEGVAASGILHCAAGKVRLLARRELAPEWDPANDGRAGAWGAVHHLIQRINEKGEQSAADLLARLGPIDDQARGLAYRLYSICERNGWSEDARDYNGLVTVWPDLEALASAGRPLPPVAEQTVMLIET